ncbi:MAG TPA: class I SAM-dependent methyltransferase [Candidatus Dormibacteraeota bacterium]|nr:class I SAM-dependent methyltransferase [Candidatus Dormibacteraeota bacterium]
MFSETAELYDLVYSWKDYAAEVERLRALVGREGGTLLDVACGTGHHLELLAPHYRVEGVDLDPSMVELARRRGLTAAVADLRTLDLGRRFDVVTCLFSSIGYVPDLHDAVARLAAHVAPGGALAVEPWLTPEQIRRGRIGLVSAESDTTKVARMSIVHIDGRRSAIEFAYLVGRAGTIEHLTERHDLWLWTRDEYGAAFAAAGLRAVYDEEGLMGRGLWVATA